MNDAARTIAPRKALREPKRGRCRGFVAAALATVLFGVLFGVLAPGSVGAQTSSVVSSTGDSAVQVGESSVAVVGFSVSPPVDSEVWLRFCFESSLADSNFSNLQTQSGNMNVSLDNNGCFDGQTVTVTVAGATTQSATIRFQPLPNTVDDLDEVVTVTVSEDPDNPLPDGVSIDAEADSVSRKIVDEDPTVVSLARSGSAAIAEGQTAELVVSLGRELVAGEMVGVPLAISGTNVTTADYDLVLKEGQGLNTGVELSGVSTTEPHLSFSGAGAQTATLLLTALLDDDTGAETVTVALGPDDATANGFDRPALETNVSGGVNRSSTQNSVSVTVNDPDAPAPPTLGAVGLGDTRVRLFWQDPKNSNITGYQFQIGTGLINPDWATVQPVPHSDASTTDYVVTGLTNDTNHNFRIRATSGGIAGAWSEASPGIAQAGRIVIPAVPAGVTATPGEASVTFNWADPGNSFIKAYQIRHRATPTGEWNPAVTVGSSLLTSGGGLTVPYRYTNNITNGTEYEFQIRAEGKGSGSQWGGWATVTATPRPAPPTFGVIVRTPPLSLPEGTRIDGDGGTYQVYLSRALGAGDPSVVELEIAVSGTATRGVDYSFFDPGQIEGANPKISVNGVFLAGKDNPVLHIDRSIWGNSPNLLVFSLPIKVVEDNVVESSDETVVLTFPGGSSTTFTLSDAPTSVTFQYGTANAINTKEGVANVTIPGNLDEATGKDFEFPLMYSKPQTRGAVSGEDYTPVDSFSVRANGNISHSLRVPIVDDDVDEPNEAFDVELGEAPTGVTKGTVTRVKVQIIDNDPTTVTLALGRGSAAVLREGTGTSLTLTLGRDLVTEEYVTVPLSVSGTGVTSGDYSLTLESGTGVNTGVTLLTSGSYSTASPAVRFDGGIYNEQVASLTLWASADSTTESTETMTVQISRAESNLDGGKPDNPNAPITVGTRIDARTVRVTVLGAPVAPTGLTASAGNAQVGLRWSDPDDPLIARYEFRTGTGSSPVVWADPRPVPNSRSTTVSYVVPDLGGDPVASLTNGTQYSVQLRAVSGNEDDGWLIGAWSDAVTATPSSSATAAPAEPINVSVSAGDNQAVLKWVDPGNGAITGYELRTGSGSPLEWKPWSAIASSDASTVAHTVTGLTNATEYSFQIRAVAGSVKGLESNTVTATPEAPALSLSSLIVAGGVTRVPEGTSGLRIGYRLSRQLRVADDPAVVTFEVAVSGNASRGTDFSFSAVTVPGLSVSGLASGNLVLSFDRDAYLAGNRRGTVLFLHLNVVADSSAEPADESVVLTPPGGRAVTIGLYDAPASVAVRFPLPTVDSAEGHNFDFGVRLSEPSGKDLVFPLEYPTEGATAVSGEDFVALESITVKANGQPSHQSRSYTHADNDVDEPNKQYTISLGDAPSGATKGTPSALTVTIKDNDPTTLTLALAGESGVAEGSSSKLTVTLSRDLVAGEIVRVPLTVTGTGVTADDYTLTLDTGSELNAGATLNTTDPFSDAAPQVVLTGSDTDTVQVATLRLSAVVDNDDTENTENLAIGFGSVTSNLDLPPFIPDTTFRTQGTTTAGAPIEFVLSEKPPAAPANFRWGSWADSLLVFEWDDPDPVDTRITGYELRRRVKSDDPWVGGWQTVSGGASARSKSEIVLSGDVGTTYEVQLRAVAGSLKGEPSGVVTAVKYPALSGATTSAGDTRVTLSWDVLGVEAVTGYEVNVGSGSPLVFDGYTLIPNSSDYRTSSFTVEGLTNGTQYTFRVRAKVGDTASRHFQVTATPSASSVARPAAPRGFSVVAGDYGVRLGWVDPGNAAISGYEVRRGVGSPLVWGEWTAISGSDADTTGHSVSGLVNGEEYSFQVRAVAGTGGGAVEGFGSLVVSAVPVAPVLGLEQVRFASAPRVPEGTVGAPFSYRLSRSLRVGEDPASVSFELEVGGSAVRGTDYSLRAHDRLVDGVSVSGLSGGNVVLTFDTAKAVLGSHRSGVFLLVDFVLDDDSSEGDESVTFSPVGGGTAASLTMYEAPAAVTVRFPVTDDQFVFEGYSVGVPVQLSEPSGRGFTYPMVVTDGSAVAGTDFDVSGVSGWTVLPNGSTAFSARIRTFSDEVDEPSKRFAVALGDAPAGAVKGSPSVRDAVIVDDDPTTVTLALAGKARVAEGASSGLTVTLSRNLVAGETVRVPLRVSGSGVTSGDYSLTLNGGSGLNAGVSLDTSSPYSVAQPGVIFSGSDSDTVQTATLVFTAVDDSTSESVENVSVRFGSVSSNLDRSDPSSFGTNGTVTAGGPVGFVLSDESLEVEATLSHPTGLRRFPEGSSVFVRTLVLNTALTAADPDTLSFEVGVAGTAVRNTDFVLFVDNDRSSEGVSVVIASDTANPVITIDKTLFGVGKRYADVGLGVRVLADSDTSESDETIILSTAGGSNTFTVHEAPDSVEVTFTEASFAVSEDNPPATFVLRLDEPTGKDLRIPLLYPSGSGNTATGDDYSGERPGFLVIKADGETSHEINFLGLFDEVDEPVEYITIRLGTAPAGLTYGAITEAVMSIRDSDPTTVQLQVAGSSQAGVPEGGTVDATIRLGRSLLDGEVVVVPLTVTGTGVTDDDYSLTLPPQAGGVNTGVTLDTTSPHTVKRPAVIFTGSTSGTVQVATVRLTAVSDNVAENTETLQLGLGTIRSNLDHYDPSARVTSSTIQVGGTVDVLIGITPVGVKLDQASLVEGELLAVTVERQSAGEAVDIPINFVIDNVGTVASSPVRISAGERTAGATLKAPNDRVDEATQEAWRVELGTLPTIYTPAPTTPDTTPGAPPAHEQLLGVQHFTVLDNDPTVVTLAASENNNGPVTEGASKQFTITLNRGLVTGETLPVPLVFGGTATRNSDYSVACPTTAPVGVSCSNNNLNRSDTPRVTFTGPTQGTSATAITLTINVATDDYLETDTATETNNDIRTGTETIHVTLGELNDTSGNGLGGGATAVNNLEAFNIVDTTDPANAIPPPPSENTATPEDTVTPENTAPVYRVPTSLIADVRGYAAETNNGVAHVTRWQQVLLAFGDTVPGFTGTPITLTEAQIYARQFWNIRWDPVVEALQQLNNNPQPQNPEPTTPDVYTVPASLIADVRSYAAETSNGTAHVTRWQRVLLAFGQTVPGFVGTPMTLAEAQTYAQQYWSVRWDPVVEALQQLANNPPPPPQSKDPQIDPQPQPEPVPPEPVLPRIGVTTHTNNITEGQNATFTLTAVPAPTTNLDVTVNITTTGDYGITPSTHTTTIDTTGTGTLTIATTNDNTDEPNGTLTLTLTLTTTTTYTIDTTNSTATININDDDAPTQTTNTPIISITDQTITEGDQTLGDLAYLNLYPVTVTLNQPHNKSVWISFTITHLGTGPGYATPHQDFAPRKLRSFIIPTGTTTKNIYVHIKNDNTKEPNETFQITLHNPLRAQIGDGQATITIKDND